jgi:hypothetical protein
MHLSTCRAFANVERFFQYFALLWGATIIISIDGVLRIAQLVGEAHLMLFCLISSKMIGDKKRPVLATQSDRPCGNSRTAGLANID